MGSEGKRERTWQRYKDAWDRRESPSMTPDIFAHLFYDGPISHEAIKLVHASDFARKTLAAAAETWSTKLIDSLGNSDVFRVWIELRGHDALESVLISERTQEVDVRRRAWIVSKVVDPCVSHFGRAWVRDRLPRWWQEAGFLEEEKESLLETLGRRNVLNWPLISQLGAEAVAAVKRLVQRGDLNAARVDGFDASSLRNIRGSQPRNRLGSRIGGLLQPVTLTLDVRDSWLQQDEILRLCEPALLSLSSNNTMLRRALRRIGHLHPMEVEELLFDLGEFGHSYLQCAPAPTGSHTIRFPLLRFLHYRLLLDSPSLGPGLESPELFLVPDVLTYTLGHDAVSYTPELRVSRDVDRRWRARWAESAGEALSIMFLESAIALDLTQLSRIREKSGEPSPDFSACTASEERIVFEAKGATVWPTHMKQRKAALRQLGKQASSSRSRRHPPIAWAGSGRSFALGLFAAQQGDARSSLLHVEDPVFAFDEYFPKGWQEQARRMHYAAVLETAQLMDAADALRQEHVSDMPPEDVQFFSIESQAETQERLSRFAGTFLPVQNLARQLRYPDVQAVENLRIFVGLHEHVYNDLRRNRLPPAIHERKERRSPNEEEFPINAPPWGLLPGRKPDLPPRGVFSSLSNGAFLAVELQ